MVRHRKQTTHYLGNAHYIVVRPGWHRCFLVEETTAFDGSRILHGCTARTETGGLGVCLGRAEADRLAEMYAAARGLQPATPDRTEA
jgi:hypothetical protein